MGKEIHYERIKGASLYIPKCRQNENAIRLLSLYLHKDVHEDGSVTAYYQSTVLDRVVSYGHAGLRYGGAY